MIGCTEVFYISIISAALLLCVLGLWFTAIIPGIDRWSKRFFQAYFSVFILCCILGFAEIAFFAHSLSSRAYYYYMIVECLALSLPLPMLTVYLLHCCGEYARSSRLMQTVFALWAVYLVVLLSVNIDFSSCLSILLADRIKVVRDCNDGAPLLVALQVSIRQLVE